MTATDSRISCLLREEVDSVLCLASSKYPISIKVKWKSHVQRSTVPETAINQPINNETQIQLDRLPLVSRDLERPSTRSRLRGPPPTSKTCKPNDRRQSARREGNGKCICCAQGEKKERFEATVVNNNFVPHEVTTSSSSG